MYLSLTVIRLQTSDPNGKELGGVDGHCPHKPQILVRHELMFLGLIYHAELRFL